MMMKRKRKERNKTQDKQVVYSTIVHHPLPYAQLIPKQ